MSTTTARYMTPRQIAEAGFEALLERLGPDGALEFVLQSEAGEGNYTHERRAIIKGFRLEDIGGGEATASRDRR